MALALKDEVFSGTDMTTNPKGREELLAAYGIGRTLQDEVAAVAAMAQGIEVDPSDLTGVARDLAEMQAAMRPKPKPAPDA